MVHHVTGGDASPTKGIGFVTVAELNAIEVKVKVKRLL